MSKKRTGLWPTPRANKVGGYSSPGFGPTLEQVVNEKAEPAPPVSNQLTLLLEGSLASLTVLPGSEEAQQMTATSGLSISELLERSDRDTSLARTFLESSPPISTRCYLTWKVKATPARRSIFQLAPSMPRTDEREFSLWPTASAQMAGEGPLLDKATDKDGNKPKQNERVYNPDTGKHIQVSLNRAVKLWPTPTSRDWRSDKSQASDEEIYGKKGKPLPRVVGGQLNPTWVEWLQGFPPGWTDLEDSETP